MAVLKKIDPNWQPAENRGLQVGQTIEIGDYVELVKQGNAVLVDEAGNEIPLPGTVFTCPSCFTQLKSVDAFLAHIETSHNPTAKPVIKTPAEKPAEVKAEVVVVEAVKTEPEKQKESFGEKMARARAAAKAKREAGGETK
jgi:hypothetical protein